MAWEAKVPGYIGGVPMSQTDAQILDNQSNSRGKFPLGMTVEAYDATNGTGTFIYLRGAASTIVGDWVNIHSDDYTAPRLLASAETTGAVAVAMSANTANNYGWYCIRGKVPANVAANFADDGEIYMTSTGARVDDAVVAGDMVHGAKGASAVSGNLADVELSYPHLAGDPDA